MLTGIQWHQELKKEEFNNNEQIRYLFLLICSLSIGHLFDKRSFVIILMTAFLWNFFNLKDYPQVIKYIPTEKLVLKNVWKVDTLKSYQCIEESPKEYLSLKSSSSMIRKVIISYPHLCTYPLKSSRWTKEGHGFCLCYLKTVFSVISKYFMKDVVDI